MQYKMIWDKIFTEMQQSMAEMIPYATTNTVNQTNSVTNTNAITGC